jgi:DHA2 family multidrug resistance protein
MQQTQTPPGEWRPKHSHWLIACAVILPTFIEVLDTTIVSVAIMNIAGSLSSSYEETLWVSTSYLVANAIILPASAWLATFFGRKRYLMGSIVLFTGSLFLCGAAPSLNFLVLARVIQGVAGGGLGPLSQAIITESFPKNQTGLGMAVYGMGVVIAPVVGPIAGGWMLLHYSWPWMFYVEIPFCILALLLVAVVVEDPPYVRGEKAGKIDLAGFGFMALWLGALQVILDKGQTWDWFSSNLIVVLASIAFVSMVAFIVWELWGTDTPIVDLRVLGNWNFSIGTALLGFFMAGMYAVMMAHPQFLQSVLGYTAYDSGLVQSPRGIGSILSFPIAGLLMMRFDPRKICALGILIFAAGTYQLHTLNLEIAMGNMVPACLIQSVGLGFIFVPLMALPMAGLKKAEVGNASGIFNLSRNVGGAIGISLISTYITRNIPVQQVQLASHLTPYDTGYQIATTQISHSFGAVYGNANALEHAHGVLGGLLAQQTAIVAFSNCFLLIALALLMLTPFVFFMRKVDLSNGPAIMH